MEFPFVFVDVAGRPTGFHTLDEALTLFNKWVHPYSEGVSLDAARRGINDHGRVLFDEHMHDCSPRIGVIHENTRDPHSLDDFINGHLWHRPRSKAYVERTLAAWKNREGPRVGDYLVQKHKTSRFTYGWDDCFQAGGWSGSYWVGDSGGVIYSGGLDQGVPRDRIEPTTEERPGSFWFFIDNSAGARRAVTIQLPCRVYREKEE